MKLWVISYENPENKRKRGEECYKSMSIIICKDRTIVLGLLNVEHWQGPNI
jgi:hypothetical protein